jgi:hypothetical protein
MARRKLSDDPCTIEVVFRLRDRFLSPVQRERWQEEEREGGGMSTELTFQSSELDASRWFRGARRLLVGNEGR